MKFCFVKESNQGDEANIFEGRCSFRALEAWLNHSSLVRDGATSGCGKFHQKSKIGQNDKKSSTIFFMG